MKKGKLATRMAAFLLSFLLVIGLMPVQVDAALAKPKITDISNNEAGGIGIMYNGVSGAASYEVVYSTNKNFSKKKTAYTSSTYYTQLTSVAKGTYYVKMRACASSNGKQVYSKYSSVKKVKVTNGAVKITLGKAKSGTLTKSKSGVAYTVNLKTAAWVKIKISAYANDSSNPKSEWCFIVKEGDSTDLTLINTDSEVKKNTKYKSPYYTYTSSEPLFLAAGEHSFNLSVLEYMFETKSYKVKYKITITETDPMVY